MSKKWIFSFYCVVIVIALMLFLIFYPQNGVDDNSNQNSTPNTDSSSTIEPSNPDEETPAQPSDPDDTSDPSESYDNNNPSNPSEEITNATSLTLNCPREITVSKNCELYFLDGFISVQPADAANHLSHTLTARSGSDIDNIIFSDNKIVGKGSGYYYLKYSVPMSEDETLSETIIIHIVDTTDDRIEQLNTELELDTAYTLDELFNISKSNAKVEIVSRNETMLTFENDTFITKSAGTVEVAINMTYDYVRYSYIYTLKIKERELPPEYAIEIMDAQDGIINLTYNPDRSYKIQYEVTNREEEYVYQGIVVEIADSSLLEIKSVTAPFITIKCKEQGTTTLTIRYGLDESIAIEIIIKIT